MAVRDVGDLAVEQEDGALGGRVGGQEAPLALQKYSSRQKEEVRRLVGELGPRNSAEAMLKTQ